MINALHLLITYQCTRECPHCFAWAGPVGPTMTAEQVTEFIEAAVAAGVEKIAFEGGEPFLYYPILAHGVRLAQERGLGATAVTNGFWAVSERDARRWLAPLAELGPLGLAISTDDYHGGSEEARRADVAAHAARQMGIEPMIFRTSIENVMFRGRAAQQLTDSATRSAPAEFTTCPHESLLEPDRIHMDAEGFLHLCQGLCPGRSADGDLQDLLDRKNLERHPIVGPLASGGPAALLDAFDLNLTGTYADACHLCYRAREALRPHFPEYLGPDRVYGVF